MTLSSASATETALQRVGEILEAEGEDIAVVVIGGAALNLLGVVDRATRDVDVLALAELNASGVRIIPPPEPLPEALVRAAREVARDLGLAPDWLNTGPALQWRQGLPAGLEHRITWRQFAGLRVGIAGRYDLVCFKLYASADQIGPQSRHMTDLLALKPSRDELSAAADWVRTQDPSPGFAKTLAKAIEYVLREAR